MILTIVSAVSAKPSALVLSLIKYVLPSNWNQLVTEFVAAAALPVVAASKYSSNVVEAPKVTLQQLNHH